MESNYKSRNDFLIAKAAEYMKATELAVYRLYCERGAKKQKKPERSDSGSAKREKLVGSSSLPSAGSVGLKITRDNES